MNEMAVPALGSCLRAIQSLAKPLDPKSPTLNPARECPPSVGMGHSRALKETLSLYSILLWVGTPGTCQELCTETEDPESPATLWV